ncbi:aprataxin and PNK-like factor [Agrilus planipennis]|uniref:Aprataxin and PNK-like factor n=1 Tax=Agrilus planipennis TaxID=224129 RepID=A0A1W4WL74_AGRPL|nr:aprataxin and PNK-like factor [Agrilus planipennis]
MKGISLYFRDTDEKIVDFLPGAYVIGRGNRLKCNDKRISHSHALLNVTPDKILLKSTHVNPCFFKPTGGLNLMILKQNESVEVKDGDTFGLLPDQFWYTVKFCDIDMKPYTKVEAEETERTSDTDDSNYSKCRTNSGSTLVENVHQSDEQMFKTERRKREIVESNVESSKKLKTSDVRENEETQASVCFKNVKLPETNVSNCDESQISGVTAAVKQEEQTNDELCKTDLNQESTNERLVSTENTNAEDDNQPSSSTTIENVISKEKKNIRDRCWYGASCYRKNPNHKKDLCHPGDSDYESDENDDRPMCSFGISCYRRNKTHRQQFRHPKTQVKLKDKKHRKKTTTATNDNDSAEEDYDYDDPFINDDSSDDYVADDDDSDSEWNLEDEDFEEEDAKRLVKEAKRFTKGTK